jgi:carlactone synthase/all-trans-10'-apo-beta-carotenal 13,14-cleaving dioxygenase
MRVFSIATFLGAALADEDVGFEAWFSSELKEVTDQELTVEGTIPDWLAGEFVQTGPAQFEMGDMKFGHALDGYAKTHKIVMGNGKVTFSTNFLQSDFYTGSKEKNKIIASMLAAETVPPSRASLGPLNGMGPNDNNYIKPVRVGDQDLATCDTMYLTLLEHGFGNVTNTIVPDMPGSSSDKLKWEGYSPPLGHLCIQGTMAHGNENADGDFVVTMGCQTADLTLARQYYVIFKMSPDDLQTRTEIATVKLPMGRRPSYMHQNAETEASYVIVGTPTYMDFVNVLKGKGLAEGGLVSPVGDKTYFHIVDKTSLSERTVKTPGFLMGHVINSYDDGDDVVVDFTTYSVESGGFFPRYLLGNLMNKTTRDSWPKGDVTRVTIHADGTSEQTGLLPDEPLADIELPSINPNYYTKSYCVVWGIQFSHGGRGMAATAVAKRNHCTGEAKSLYIENQYMSEPRFVPRPGATEEDDGVLIGMVFDGATQQSRVQFVDASSLEVLATAPFGMKVPFPIHTTWFGASGEVTV